MKAVVFRKPHEIIVEERPLPRIERDGILVKVRSSGICGTDVHILHGEHIVRFPVIPGHEFSGEVVEIGPDVNNVEVGDRVTVDPNIVDRTCFFCLRGEPHLCENLTALGVNFDGGFAEYCAVPAPQALEVPDAVGWQEAAMIEPVACCLHGMDRISVSPGESVVVLGVGFIGLLLIQMARIAGAGLIVVSEPDRRKRELASRVGATHAIDPQAEDVEVAVKGLAGVGADVVIECAGTPETAQLALSLARRGGRVLQFGVVAPDARIKISPYDVYYRELTIRGSFVNPFTHSRAVELVASGQLQIASLITHRFSLDQAADAFQAAQSPDSVKVLLVPNE